MRHRRLIPAALLCVGLLAGVYAWARQDVQSIPTHRFFHVQLGAGETQPMSGRLLLFAMDAASAKAQSKDGNVTEVDANPFFATQTSIAAENVDRLVPGQMIDIDADQLAFPDAWSKLPAGDYVVQAVLDVRHDYNYLGREAGDVVSDVVTVHLPANDIPTLTLDKTLPREDPWALPDSMPAAMQQAVDAAHKHSQLIDFVSPSLSAFWGRPIHMLGRVLLPPGYDASSDKRYPTVYFTHGFGGNNDRFARPMAYRARLAMARARCRR